MEKTTAPAVAATMRRLGAGELSVAEAAELVGPAYAAMLAAPAERRRTDPTGEIDPDAASASDALVEVAAARQVGAISMEQSVALGERLRQLSLDAP